jgi:hypothetical protein
MGKQLMLGMLLGARKLVSLQGLYQGTLLGVPEKQPQRVGFSRWGC